MRPAGDFAVATLGRISAGRASRNGLRYERPISRTRNDQHVCRRFEGRDAIFRGGRLHPEKFQKRTHTADCTLLLEGSVVGNDGISRHRDRRERMVIPKRSLGTNCSSGIEDTGREEVGFGQTNLPAKES